ncbi:putative ATPase-dependent protease [Ranavirus ambystoma1]|uniref:Putative ATPase-dependent protease n=1 Tax=Ranavirus ambystoma1 TaxID=265294 RepID=A0A0U2K618_9VIRU|nr:putative ATPase-dependent protease [Ambystoma tigrinum virus]ALN37329.1 putative ATPase-dependent protease [Ambystoma tigrinum virus]ALN37530.1 putative ATPase-dependent protease [Ambystoma tigrinum virus]ALN37729.1 putative ATPase-dependent protease [Ambystoma tigrinum virus]
MLDMRSMVTVHPALIAKPKGKTARGDGAAPKKRGRPKKNAAKPAVCNPVARADVTSYTNPLVKSLVRDNPFRGKSPRGDNFVGDNLMGDNLVRDTLLKESLLDQTLAEQTLRNTLRRNNPRESLLKESLVRDTLRRDNPRESLLKESLRKDGSRANPLTESLLEESTTPKPRRGAHRKPLVLTKEMEEKLEALDRDMRNAEETKVNIAGSAGIPVTALPGMEAMGVMQMVSSLGFLDAGDKPNFIKTMVVKYLDVFLSMGCSAPKPCLVNVPRGYRRFKQSSSVSPAYAAKLSSEDTEAWSEAAGAAVEAKMRHTAAVLESRNLSLEPYGSNPIKLERSALAAYVELMSMAEEAKGEDLEGIISDCRVLRTSTKWCRDLSQTVSSWWPPLREAISRGGTALSDYVSDREVDIIRGRSRVPALSCVLLYGKRVDNNDAPLTAPQTVLKPFDVTDYSRRLGGVWLHHARFPEYAPKRLFDPRPGAEPVLIRTCAGYLMTEERGPLRCWRKDAHMYQISLEIYNRLTTELNAVPPQTRCGRYNAKWLFTNGPTGVQKIVLAAARALTEPRLSWNDVFEV